MTDGTLLEFNYIDIRGNKSSNFIFDIFEFISSNDLYAIYSNSYKKESC